MKEYEFVIGVDSNEECVAAMHKSLAIALIKKYGVETMKEVVNRLEKNDHK